MLFLLPLVLAGSNDNCVLHFSQCVNAIWTCRPATDEEIKYIPKKVKHTCDADNNEELTQCKPTSPRTCKVSLLTINLFLLICKYNGIYDLELVN